jgi:hypothetical protein
MLLLSMANAKYSSEGEQSMLKILWSFVAKGYHFLIKSNACFPEVELFSSDLTHKAMWPLSEAIKNPFEKGLINKTDY